jgi:hypothetical protein
LSGSAGWKKRGQNSDKQSEETPWHIHLSPLGSYDTSSDV